MMKKGDDNEVRTPLHTMMNMTDNNVPCQTPLPFNGTTTTPTAQTDNHNKHNPAVPNVSTKKLSRREDDEVCTVRAMREQLSLKTNQGESKVNI
jgi:hypothetical protein